MTKHMEYDAENIENLSALLNPERLLRQTGENWVELNEMKCGSFIHYIWTTLMATGS